ncbi:MAG: ATP-dependent Clp protease ATP-binding subunit, partial [Rhodococcus sp.]|nr:ATP-dependent Clp protease ATP-binding subunit [Rhodococcus sp. (in: high G+C Gram-positive bacteria)]
MTEGWISRDPFDDILNRFFGSGSNASRAQVQRVDLGKLLNDDAKTLVEMARRAAQDWGSPEITPEHLLYAATLSDPARSLISGLGLDPDDVAEQMRDVVPKNDPPEDGPITLSPGSKLALRTAQQQAGQSGVSYIGPELIILGIASNPESAAAKVLSGAKLDAPTAAGGPPSTTPTLDEYGRDLTAEARSGNVDPVVGRADEISQSIEILSRRRKNNPVLIGDPGVGKTAIVEGLAQRIVNDDVPSTLAGRRVIALDVGSLVAGS